MTHQQLYDHLHGLADGLGPEHKDVKMLLIFTTLAMATARTDEACQMAAAWACDIEPTEAPGLLPPPTARERASAVENLLTRISSLVERAHKIILATETSNAKHRPRRDDPARRAAIRSACDNLCFVLAQIDGCVLRGQGYAQAISRTNEHEGPTNGQ